MGLESGGGTKKKKKKKKKKEKKEEEKFLLCESIGHRPLRGRCPKITQLLSNHLFKYVVTYCCSIINID